MRPHFTRGLLIVAPLSCALAACGTIDFTGTNDAAISPSDGSTPGADGGQPVPDAGPPCRQRSLPALQTAWPYQRTLASYEAHFGALLPQRAGCSTSVCHGGMVGTASTTWAPPTYTPLIPPLGATLDANSVVNTIDGIWARVLPTISQTPPPQDPVAPLIWHHAAPPDGSNQAPAYTADQLTYMKSFITTARQCGWVLIQMQEQGKPPQNCVGGVCDCPITLDLSYCNQ